MLNIAINTRNQLSLMCFNQPTNDPQLKPKKVRRDANRKVRQGLRDLAAAVNGKASSDGCRPLTPHNILA
jgi:hypothetical protein